MAATSCSIRGLPSAGTAWWASLEADEGAFVGRGLPLQMSPLGGVCSLLADVRAAEGGGVHLPYGLLRQHRGGAVGRPDHLQDTPEFCLPAGHEVSAGRLPQMRQAR